MQYLAFCGGEVYTWSDTRKFKKGLKTQVGNISVYEEIYNVVAENLHLADKEFGYGKATFLCDVETHPRDICVSEYLHLPNPEFMQAIYVAALKRLPDERTVSFWSEKYDMEKEAFQREVLGCIANSSVVAINQIRLLDNPYFEQKRGLKYRTLGLLYGLTDKAVLREFGKKLPMPVQKIIRKVFL